MKSLIGNNWCDAKDGSVIEVKNPATNMKICNRIFYFRFNFLDARCVNFLGLAFSIRFVFLSHTQLLV